MYRSGEVRGGRVGGCDRIDVSRRGAETLFADSVALRVDNLLITHPFDSLRSLRAGSLTPPSREGKTKTQTDPGDGFVDVLEVAHFRREVGEDFFAVALCF